MSVFIWLLVLLLLIFIILGAVLFVMFIRLGRELQQLNVDTTTTISRLQRATRSVQVLVPAVALVRRTIDQIRKKRRETTYGKKVREK